MKVLQIGTDRSIFDADSASASRMREYGENFGELNIIVFSLRKHGARKADLSEYAHAYATDSFSRFLYAWDAIRLALKLPKPDVISAQDPFEVGLAGWVAARMRGVPLHIQAHTDFLSPEYAKHSFLNRLRVFAAGFVLRRAARIRVVSERIRDSLKTKNYKLKTKPTVLPIFVDVESFRNTRTDESLAKRFAGFGTRILVVSRLESEKNVALAIRELANLVLAPSLYEGYGMVIVEALASGVPVLSTDVGIAQETGTIVAPQEKFAEALAEWFKNGPRTGELKNYPYKNFDEYAEAYCDDIRSSAFS